MAQAIPVATMSDGSIRYSDGSVKKPASSATNSSVANYRPANGVSSFQPYTPTSSPTKGVLGAATNSGAGYTGSIRGDAEARAAGYGDYSDYLNKMASSQQPDYGQIDSAFGEASSLLDQFEQNTRAGEQDLYTSAIAPVEAQKPILEQARQQGLAGVEGQKGEAQLQEQNALAAARRLYQELTQGAKQRFGAGNSAGEFANSLLGREFQKNVGSIRQTAGQNMQSLLGKSQEIQSNYNTQLQALEQQKEGLLAQARDEFRRRIDAINNTRFGLAQNKAQAKLQELQNLRAYAQSLQAQAIQFQQQLQANVQQAQLQLEAQVQAYRAQAGQPVSMAAFSNPAYTQLPGATVSTNNPQTTGFLSFGTNREDERNRMFA